MKFNEELLKGYLDNKLIIYDETASTNQIAKELCKSGEGEGTVIIANSQTSGKGRMGRSFISNSENGLYFTLILRPKIDAEGCTLITVLAATAVARAIEEISNKNAQIKWVNDIIVNDKKVCGILTEAGFGAGQTLDYAVLGIGINIAPPKGGFDDEIKDVAGAIFERCEKCLKEKLFASIIKHFFNDYYQLEKKEYVRYYVEKSSIVGKEVDVYVGDRVVCGVATDIDENASLIVKTNEGKICAFSSGEARVRESGKKL